MKKLLFIAVIFCILTAFTSCGTGSAGGADVSENEPASTTAAASSVPQPVETTAAELELNAEESSEAVNPPTIKVNTVNVHGLEIGLYYCSPWGYEWAYPDENGNMVSEVTDVADPLEHIGMLNEVSTEEVASVRMYLDEGQPQPTVITVYRLNADTNEFEDIGYKDSFTVDSEGGEIYKISITYLQGTADYYFRTVKPAEEETTSAADGFAQ